MTTEKTIALTRRNFVGKVMFLLFNMLSRLVIIFLPREMQIKTAVRYHRIPVRMAIIKKSTINAGEGVEKREPSCTVGGNVD